SFHSSYAHLFTNNQIDAPIYAIILLLGFYIIGLTAIGVMLIVFSLFCPNTIITWSMGILLCVLAWSAYPWNMVLASWLPSVRLNLAIYFVEESSDLFMLNKSLGYFF